MSSPAAGEQRVALVIGNSSYTKAPLTNPVNDARAMAQTLRLLGFEVLYEEDQSQNDLKRAIRTFGQRTRSGGVRLFYYAGHGIQVDGENYLIPIDANISNEREVEYEAVNVGLVLAQLEETRNSLNIVILDACRNNPFTRSFRLAARGLAAINAPAGTIIAYATAPGAVASDGSGNNGLYTQELLRYMQMPNLSLEDIFKQVRISVRSKSQGKQIPWESSSLTGNFYFNRKSKLAQSEGNVADTSQESLPKIPSTPQPSVAPPPDSFRKEGKFYTFELKQCKISGGTVICDFDVTNNENDRELGVSYYGCFSVDDKGNNAQGTAAKIANSVSAYNSAPRSLLVRGVTVRGRIKFDDVNPDATKIALLKLGFITDGGINADLVITFRDVPLVR